MSARLIAIAGLAAAALVGGCGNSTHTVTAEASGQTPPTTRTSPAATSSARSSRKESARHAGTRQLELIANTVCRAVRAGAPTPPQGHVTTTNLQRYAIAAQPIARRTAISLQRLGAQTGQSAVTGRLARDYQRLDQLYLIAASRPKKSRQRSASLARSLTTVERQASADANASGLLSCAPLKPGSA